jgi:hypothetical protein
MSLSSRLVYSRAEVGQVTYLVREEHVQGREVGSYKHPGMAEPGIGTLIELVGRRWRVTDYRRPAVPASENNILVVEPLD